MLAVRLFVLCAFGSGLWACGATPLIERPTLCQLAEAREAYAGRTLTVEGYLLVSGHGSGITDPRCGYGVGIAWWSDSAPDLRELNEVAGRMQRLEAWMVRVRVTGVMRQSDEEGFAGRPWQLELAAADVLEARRLPDGDAERYLSWLEGPSPRPFQPTR